MVREEPTRSGDTVPRPRQTNKKQQIMALYVSGIVDIEDLATITNTRASYVGKGLQDAGLIHGYFDLYTSTAHPMNVYSKLFAGKLGFRDEEAARRSVTILERRVRIRTYTEEHPVEKPMQVREERVTVERHPVDRPATSASTKSYPPAR